MIYCDSEIAMSDMIYLSWEFMRSNPSRTSSNLGFRENFPEEVTFMQIPKERMGLGHVKTGCEDLEVRGEAL